MENKTVIEINGVKLEIDLRHAQQIESYKVGDNVKLLKKTYSDTWESFPGVIAGFDNFNNRPTIIVAYVKWSYSDSSLEFAYIHKDAKELEICKAHDFDLTWQKGDIISKFNQQIEKKRDEIRDMERKKSYFIEKFSTFFEQPK